MTVSYWTSSLPVTCWVVDNHPNTFWQTFLTDGEFTLIFYLFGHLHFSKHCFFVFFAETSIPTMVNKRESHGHFSSRVYGKFLTLLPKGKTFQRQKSTKCLPPVFCFIPVFSQSDNINMFTSPLTLAKFILSLRRQRWQGNILKDFDW